MKVTVQLLARLLELERCLQRCVRQQALTAAEVRSAQENIALVRELIPESVLTSYERMKITEVELLDCPHAFAVAVLLSSYRQAGGGTALGGTDWPVRRPALLRLASGASTLRSPATEDGQEARELASTEFTDQALIVAGL